MLALLSTHKYGAGDYGPSLHMALWFRALYVDPAQGRPISQHALKFHDHLACHDYEGIALDLAERERLVRDLSDHQCMILRNHGLLAAGRTIPEAFINIYFLERACQAQIKAQAGGAALTSPPEDVRRRTAQQFQREGVLEYCEMAWQSALRLLG